ncbi:putative uncharacterized protein DDB_G0292330 [Odontomachus brunneus]|uniref:putative uncharacterized protein DDB_G0292330 n=1 Tax=Odontomachus brunneus TaxID=486640 RepID=UPI0013F22544|nr:putative uncharacterized protein DDB_G0292330 [Odontomachus brunneus]
MSSKYTSTLGSSLGLSILSNRRWNFAGAECKPNGITLNCNSPFPGTVNAVKENSGNDTRATKTVAADNGVDDDDDDDDDGNISIANDFGNGVNVDEGSGNGGEDNDDGVERDNDNTGDNAEDACR